MVFIHDLPGPSVVRDKTKIKWTSVARCWGIDTWTEFSRPNWKVQVKVTQNSSWRRIEGVEVEVYSFFNLGARCERMVSVTPRPLYPRERTLVPHEEDVWTPGPVWDGAENLASTGIRSPDRQACSESLYRLSYRGPCRLTYEWYISVVDINMQKMLKMCFV
jgi:hypothetical protein